MGQAFAELRSSGTVARSDDGVHALERQQRASAALPDVVRGGSKACGSGSHVSGYRGNHGGQLRFLARLVPHFFRVR